MAKGKIHNAYQGWAVGEHKNHMPKMDKVMAPRFGFSVFRLESKIIPMVHIQINNKINRE